MFFNKKIKLYGVFLENDMSKLLTIVQNKQDINEYVNKLLKLEHSIHYSTWLQVRSLQDSEDNWKEYFNKVLTDEDKLKFSVCKLVYKKEQLSSILRMFCGCTPIGCSFNTQAEYNYFSQQYGDDYMETDTSEDDLDLVS